MIPPKSDDVIYEQPLIQTSTSSLKVISSNGSLHSTIYYFSPSSEMTKLAKDTTTIPALTQNSESIFISFEMLDPFILYSSLNAITLISSGTIILRSPICAVADEVVQYLLYIYLLISQTVHFPIGGIRSTHKSPLQLVLLTLAEVVHYSKTQLVDSLLCLLKQKNLFAFLNSLRHE